jgi:hypothetical protein
LALSLALLSSSGEAFSFKVTCEMSVDRIGTRMRSQMRTLKRGILNAVMVWKCWRLRGVLDRNLLLSRTEKESRETCRCRISRLD